MAVGSPGPITATAAVPTPHPTKAAVSIMPSSPIFTTPVRSLSVPASAARPMGIEMATAAWAMIGSWSIRNAKNWMTKPRTGTSVSI